MSQQQCVKAFNTSPPVPPAISLWSQAANTPLPLPQSPSLAEEEAAAEDPDGVPERRTDCTDPTNKSDYYNCAQGRTYQESCATGLVVQEKYCFNQK